jgi:hypothetical protein
MADNYFVYANRVPAGRVVFDVTNAGQSTHRLSLYRLPEGTPSVDAQSEASSQFSEPPLQNMAALDPGQRSMFAVDLMPGARYAMVSLWAGPDGVPDAQRGMTSEFLAGGRAVGRPPDPSPPG